LRHIKINLTLDNSDKNLELSTPLFIQNQIKNSSNRYFLIIFFKGYYNANFQPYHYAKQGMATNTLYINPNRNLVSSDIRVVIFDNKKNIIVYYTKKHSKNTDPRLTDFIEKMTLDILRPVYYK